MRVLLVDNDRLLLDALKLAIEARHRDLDVDVAVDEAAAVSLAAQWRPQLVLLDWWLDTDGAAHCFNALSEACPHARIVVMSGDDSAGVVAQALELGACGFLRKNAASFESMREAIDIVMRGGIYLPGHLPVAVSPSPSVRPSWHGRDLAECFPQLTPRQLAVLRVLLRGASDKIIARELGIGLATVKTHVTELYRRIGVGGRAEAVSLAARRGARID
ncbi:LuxR C-terminal-related transcriptional regulator [Azohydromonas sediminis]|uniref:LuxR C-terminal-related transcriptional regulator n=1 Tax=Azohydromonas sediminis TaxID=2259674 RepID=UPI0013C31799|nr:response regulator transcription factor [Azohydromonas sediminis]